MTEQVWLQPDTGKLPILIGELLPENGTEGAGLRRVKRWGVVEQVEEVRLRGSGVDDAAAARLRRNPEALAAVEAFAADESNVVAVNV